MEDAEKKDEEDEVLHDSLLSTLMMALCLFFFAKKTQPSDRFNRLLMYDKLNGSYEVDYLKILQYKLDSISNVSPIYIFRFFLRCHQYRHLTSTGATAAIQPKVCQKMQ